MKGRHEVEIVDMVLKLRDKLNIGGRTDASNGDDSALVTIPLPAETRDRLARQLSEMCDRLPDDVRHLFGDDGTPAKSGPENQKQLEL